MIRSMTGFGAAGRETDRGVLNVEIRTENHRHLHTHFRLPAEAERFEPELGRLIKERLSRGHVRFRLDFGAGGEPSAPVEIDHDRVAAYAKALDEIDRVYIAPRAGPLRRVWRTLFGGGGADQTTLSRFSDILKPPGTSDAVDRDELIAAAGDALEMVLTAREREGQALKTDLARSAEEIEDALATVLERAPARLLEERERLRAAVAELAGDATLDEERMAREIAYIAERWDINEEVVRLKSHLAEFRALIEGDGAEPVGKRLGFWVQEMLREVNTIGSKGNDAEIARRVVDMKAAIERIREQVENVE